MILFLLTKLVKLNKKLLKDKCRDPALDRARMQKR